MTSRVGDRIGRGIIEEDEGNLVLVGSRCSACGDIRYPPRELCPVDLSKCERFFFDGDGVIYEAVRVDLPPLGFEAPYWVGYVDLREGVRVFAPLLVEEGTEDPRHGDRVRVEFRLVRQEPDELIGPAFRHTEED